MLYLKTVEHEDKTHCKFLVCYKRSVFAIADENGVISVTVFTENLEPHYLKKCNMVEIGYNKNNHCQILRGSKPVILELLC